MKYIVDITKPPIPPPAPPCRTFNEIGMFFPVRVETTESKALTDRYEEFVMFRLQHGVDWIVEPVK